MPKIKIGNKTFEVSKEKFDGDQQEIVIDGDFTIRTPEEEDSFISNHKKEARKEGVEIAVKKTRESLGLDFQGKTIENLVKSAQEKAVADSSIEPNEQIDLLRQTLKDKDTALSNAINRSDEISKDFTKYKNQNKIDNDISKYLPDNIIIPKDDMMMLLKNKTTFHVEEGNVISLDANGKKRSNPTTAEPLTSKEVVDDFFRENPQYLGTSQGNQSGKDSNGYKEDKQSLDDFIKEQQDAGVQLNSEEFNRELNARNEKGLIDLD